MSAITVCQLVQASCTATAGATLPEHDIYAAVRVIEVSLIDTGRTVAVQLEKADGERATILLSQAVCDDLQRQLQAVTGGPGTDAA